MITIDLHNDWSNNALYMTHKNFFKKNKITNGRNDLGWGIVNQVDLPRLKQGGVNIVFGASCILPDEMIADLSIRKYSLDRHLHYYKYLIEKSEGEIYQINSYQDSKKNIQKKKIGLLLHIEGYYFHDENDLQFEYVDKLYEKGVRSIGLTRNIDTNIAGGAKGQGYGLTKIGKKFVEKLNNKGILIDLAHSSEQTFWDTIELSSKPVIISHTQLKHFLNTPRNISDDQIKAIAKKGGVIGLTPLAKFIGKNVGIDDYINTLDYLKNIGGEDCVAIGTDFDGFMEKEDIIQGFYESSDFPNLEKLLSKKGRTQKQIEKAIGKNALRVIECIL